MKWLLEKGTVVICAGGGGIPTMYGDEPPAAARRGRGRRRQGPRELASGAEPRRGFSHGHRCRRRVRKLRQTRRAAIGARRPRRCQLRLRRQGSMGPKVEAACEFVELTGGMAVIGSIEDAAALLRGEAGTTVSA